MLASRLLSILSASTHISDDDRISRHFAIELLPFPSRSATITRLDRAGKVTITMPRYGCFLFPLETSTIVTRSDNVLILLMVTLFLVYAAFKPPIDGAGIACALLMPRLQAKSFATCHYCYASFSPFSLLL